jgi:hypothetical protein
MKKNYLKVLTLFSVAAAICIIATSCSKEKLETTKKLEITTEVNNSEDHNQLKAFLAWCIQLSPDTLKYDTTSKEFYVPNTIVREKLEVVREEYNKAAEYRLNFERK